MYKVSVRRADKYVTATLGRNVAMCVTYICVCVRAVMCDCRVE